MTVSIGKGEWPVLRAPKGAATDCLTQAAFVVQVAKRVAEPEGHEAIEEAEAVIDRRLGQPTLVAKIGHILQWKAIERR